MSLHKWKQNRFDSHGEYQGMKTCLQGWKCENCKLEIDLPMGTNPTDYDTTRCKEAHNEHRIDSSKMSGSELRKDIRVLRSDEHPRNRHEVRRLRVQQQLSCEI